MEHTCGAEDFLEAISPPIIALVEGGSSMTGEGCFALPKPPLKPLPAADVGDVGFVIPSTFISPVVVGVSVL